jgi:hypothetical protein
MVIEPGGQYLIAIRPDAADDLKGLFRHRP